MQSREVGFTISDNDTPPVEGEPDSGETLVTWARAVRDMDEGRILGSRRDDGGAERAGLQHTPKGTGRRVDSDEPESNSSLPAPDARAGRSAGPA